MEQTDSNDIQVIETNRLFKVKSCSKKMFRQLDLGDKYTFLHGPDMIERSTRCVANIFLLFLSIKLEFRGTRLEIFT